MYTYTAFENFEILTWGGLEEVAIDVRKRLKAHPSASIFIFSDSTGKEMDLDFSGTEKEMLSRLKVYASTDPTSSPGPGRPKLGVVSREVSLLPQHWEWCSMQEGGASAAIRRLVEEKTKAPMSAKDKTKHAQEVAYRFLSAIAGNLPNFEDAIRFLYRRDKKKFKELIADWPADLVTHTMNLTEAAFV
jgi:hypothetical protein